MRVFLNTKSTKIFLIIIENIFKVHKGVKLNEEWHAARLERKSFFANNQVLFRLKSSAKKIGSGRRIKLPKF